MSECERTVLVVENRLQTLEKNRSLFEDEGYRVLTASDPEEAKARAEEEVIHLAVIDIRLRDDDDKTDLSGLLLAADLADLHPSIYKVVTTAQEWDGLPKLILDALSPDEQGRVQAANFVPVKLYHPTKLLEVVNEAFQNNIRIDTRLKVEMSRDLSWETIVDQLKMFRENGDSRKGKADEAQFKRQKGVQVLKDLTCRLFSATQEVVPKTIRFLSTTPGYSPCTVAMVRPHFSEGRGVELALKFGPRTSIDREVLNYNKFVKPYIRRSTRLEYGPVWSRQMGALAYTFVGDDVKSVETLRTYYKDVANVSDEALCDILEHLFSQTCARWYEERDNISKQDLKPLDILYREQLNLLDPLQVSKLQETFTKLLKGNSSDQKVFKLVKDRLLEVNLGEKLKITLPNPLTFCFEKHCSTASKKKHDRERHFFPVSSQYATTHGDLHASNVIVNQDGHTWLIDFYKTGVGHVLRDFAELESDIKFTLFNSKSLSARYQLEKALLAPKSLEEPLAPAFTPSPQQARALAAISRLRQLACKLTDTNASREYYMALLFYALKSMGGFTSGSGTTQDNRITQSHALLSAAMLCQRLSFALPDKEGTVFLAHDYRPLYTQRIYTRLKPFIQKLNFMVAHPLDDSGGGQLWPRVADMIGNTDVGFYELSTRNGNVYFELGYALGLKKPYFSLIERKNQNPLKRPPLLGGELVHDYVKESDLNRRVEQVLANRDKWKDWFFFMKPGFERDVQRVKLRRKSALLFVANTGQRQRDLASTLKSVLEDEYGWSVEVVPLEKQVNIENFYHKVLKVELVVGCFSADRVANSRYANAELALALGITHGMGKQTIILQEEACKVLTDLMPLTITFRGAEGAAENLRRQMGEKFRRRGSVRQPSHSEGGGRGRTASKRKTSTSIKRQSVSRMRAAPKRAGRAQASRKKPLRRA